MLLLLFYFLGIFCLLLFCKNSLFFLVNIALSARKVCHLTLSVIAHNSLGDKQCSISVLEFLIHHMICLTQLETLLLSVKVAV